MAKKPTPPSNPEVQAAVQALYDSLSQAYWSASTIDAKDRIYGTEEVLLDTLTNLAREDIEDRTETFEAALENVKPVLARLDQLRADLDKIIHAVKVAAQVADAIDQAVKQLTKYFAV